MASLQCMMSKMKLVLPLLVLGIAVVQADFIISQAPSYVKFAKDGGKIDVSEIPHVITSSLGYSLPHDLKWTGMKQSSLFRRPKANVVFSVEGMNPSLVKLMDVKKQAVYDTNQDDATLNTETIINHLQQEVANPLIVDFSAGNVAYDLRSIHPRLFSTLPVTLSQVKQAFLQGKTGLNLQSLGTLNVTQKGDQVLLGELHLIQEIVTALRSHKELLSKDSPDLFHFRVQGVSQLLKHYNQDAQQLTDAMHTLATFINAITEEFKTLYKDHVVVEVLTLPPVDPAKVRVGRSLMQEKPTTAPDTPNMKLNLAPGCDPLFPVMFNIILWLVIVLVVTIAWISLCIWNMDPGRDSIIYRMTEQRIKKD